VFLALCRHYGGAGISAFVLIPHYNFEAAINAASLHGSDPSFIPLIRAVFCFKLEAWGFVIEQLD
jgi:hypothetical protein